jgi:hypothetical protein
MGGGLRLRRDRPGEFAASGDDATALIAHIERIARDVHQAATSVERARLATRLLPPQELWGEGTPREISVREAFLHAIEHASLHLGHMELTRELLTAG